MNEENQKLHTGRYTPIVKRKNDGEHYSRKENAN